MTWESERLFYDGEEFYNHVTEVCRSTKHSLDLSVYIWESDRIGKKVADDIWQCHQRGVKVRIVVDGFGSLAWLKSPEARRFFDARILRIYHPLPWTLSDYPLFSHYWWKRWLRINSRTHLKVLISDEYLVLAGSRNANEDGVKWREVCFQTTGGEVASISALFHTTWNLSHDWFGGRALARMAAAKTPGSTLHTNLVFHTRTGRERRRRYQELLNRINSAQERLWIVTPYFHPVRGIRKAIAQRASEGVDVRIILPKKSDVLFSTWINESYCDDLCRAGIKVYRYLPTILHAKLMLGDDWCLIGSSNLNHRSFLKDLEIDVILNSPSSLKVIEQEFLKDQADSELMGSPSQIRWLFFKKLLSGSMYYFRDSF
jgi:cardiolipin synthase